jgi:hypothetical protein
MLMVLFVSLVPLSSLTILQTANATGVNDSNVLPSRYVDFTAYMKGLGYTEKEVSEMSELEYLRILLTDGGRINVDINMEEICQDLFGNSTGIVSDSKLDKNIDSTTVSEEEQSGLTSRLPLTKACLIIAIWNYPDSTQYQYQIENQYPSLLSTVNTYGGYSYVKTLTNSVATKSNVLNALIGLCANYDIVDMYFIGHGFYGNNGYYGYCCYDGINSYGVIQPYGLFYGQDLKSYYLWNADFSTLRLGVGSFCYSGAFKDYFLDEGYVWIGSNIGNNPSPIDSDYVLAYMTVWGDYWYRQNVGSSTAHNSAHANGELHSNSSPCQFPLKYYVKGSGILSIYH